MRILIIGAGGREHALAWALAQSPRRPELYIAPGNPGTAALGENVPLSATDLPGLSRFAREMEIDLAVVGPEAPLVMGVVDRFEAEGIPVVGPTAAGARLEGSKSFAKAFMERHGIPTARYRSFGVQEIEQAEAFVRELGAPLVLKADGLAAGKGVLIGRTVEDALRDLRMILLDRAFGAAGETVVVEEFLRGEEASLFAVTDGRDYVLLTPAQDHKRVGEGDTGPNTGGMGAYAPTPVVTPEVLEAARTRIVEPTLRGMAAEGVPYRGFLYCGLMITADGPKVIEYNCRLGDPEAQVVLPLLETDAVSLLEAVVAGTVAGQELSFHPGAAACVVLTSEGYPGSYRKHFPIEGLEAATRRALVFHAGTEQREDGSVVTAGGRVLGLTGRGPDLAAALENAYRAADSIRYQGKQYRRDIGRRGLTEE